MNSIINKKTALNHVDRIDCAIRLAGDYQMSGGSDTVSKTHEWKILKEDAEMLRQLLEGSTEIDGDVHG